MKSKFLWGAATSAHQVEGRNTLNDWWEWEQQGKVRESSGDACDHYRLFQEDFTLARELGHTAHRFSLEWSRMEPEEGRWDEEAIRHYQEVLRSLLDAGIEPVVTLHHFTNPLWFTRLGGWLSEKSIFYFSRYVKKVTSAFGPLVRYWITVNEPMVYIYYSYYVGEWPPGLKSFKDSVNVLYHLLKGHIAAYQAIHGYYAEVLKRRAWVSLAHHITCFTPCRRSSVRDLLTTAIRHWFVNDMILNALQSGFLFFPGVFCEFLPRRGTLDFLGINYYARDFIKFSREEFFGALCDKSHHRDEIKELNTMGWDVYPEGFYRLLKKLRRFRLPVLITENGMCANEDARRQKYIKSHLEALARARAEGAPVMGYLYWSLLDNFEWAWGFGPRFGIVEVDYATQKRKVRTSAQTLSECCRKIASESHHYVTERFV